MDMTTVATIAGLLGILLILGLFCWDQAQWAKGKPASLVSSVCPRQRDEAVLPVQREHRTHITIDGRCSYCGSLTEDLFLQAVRDGCELGPTDKNYKVYVKRPNPRAGKSCVVGSRSWTDSTGQRCQENIHGTEPATTHDKFYFQHLSQEGRDEFLRLLNECKVKIGMPGYFYVLPFFARRADPK